MVVIEIVLLAVTTGLLTGILLLLFDRKKLGKKIAKKPIANIPDNEIILDYSKYFVKKKELLLYVIIAGIVLYVIAFIFYQNQLISLIMALGGLYYPKNRKKELIAKRKQDLVLQFKQAIYSLSSALAAGRSVENAFQEAVKDLKLLYPDKNTYIIQEFELINKRIANGVPIEKAILDFSDRSQIEDIANFADVFATCKRTGGDLIEVIRRTSNIIAEKLEIQQEILVLIAQKKLEAKILSIAPFIMIALINLSSPDYMEPLYEFGIGPVIMTFSLITLGFAYWLSKWIINIKV